MPGPITTADLVDQVRDQTDESNAEDLSPEDIVQALGRGQRKAVGILARKYPEYFITSTPVTMIQGTDTYDIPEAAYGRRIEQVTCIRGSYEYPLQRVSYRDLWRYTSPAQVSVPTVYAIKGRSYVIKPLPSGALSLKVWYAAAPETVVLPLGRISAVSVAGNYVALDALDTALTTDTAALGAFVNIVDAQTGAIKVSLQVASLTTASKRVTFKSSGLTLSSVYNRTIDTAIPTTIDVNDYVCAIQGTCVPDLPDSCLDYMIQFAVMEIRRRFGELVQEETQALAALEQKIESEWVGREINARITNKARAWAR